MKLCIDCKHYNDHWPDECKSPNRPAVDFVSGMKAPLLPAFTSRMNNDLCGLSAKWFDTKAIEPAPRIARAWSDFPNHVIVRYGNNEHGYDLPCAQELLKQLQQAVQEATPKAPDPGEGWRLIVNDNPNETTKDGDQVWTDACGWVNENEKCIGQRMQQRPYKYYRRRIEPEIERCPDGHEAMVVGNDEIGFTIRCKDAFTPVRKMWISPTYKKESEVRSAWNSVMRAYRKSKELPTRCKEDE